MASVDCSDRVILAILRWKMFMGTILQILSARNVSAKRDGRNQMYGVSLPAKDEQAVGDEGLHSTRFRGLAIGVN